MTTMSAKFQLTNPDTALATLTVTMTITDWKKVRDDLANGQAYASSHLHSLIRKVVTQAEARFDEVGEYNA
jgi:hypothetical protein